MKSLYFDNTKVTAIAIGILFVSMTAGALIAKNKQHAPAAAFVISLLVESLWLGYIQITQSRIADDAGRTVVGWVLLAGMFFIGLLGTIGFVQHDYFPGHLRKESHGTDAP